MDDPGFETHLSRLFSVAPVYADAPLFAMEIEARLGRGWALRRVLIAAAGAAGGLIAVGQVIGSGFAARLSGASRALSAARAGFDHLPLPVAPQLSMLRDMPFGGEVVWLVAGFAVLAAALLASRSIEDL